MAVPTASRVYLDCIHGFRGEQQDDARRQAAAIGRELAEAGAPAHVLEARHAEALQTLIAQNARGLPADLAHAAALAYAQALIAYAEVVQQSAGHELRTALPRTAWDGFDTEEGQERLRLALEASHMATWVWDMGSRSFEGDPRFRALLGWDNGHANGNGNGHPARGRTYEDFLAAVHPQDVGKVTTAVFDLLTHNRRYDVEYRVLVDRETRYVSSQAIVKRGADGVATRIFGVCLDVTERKALLDGLEQLSHLDALTGVLNRRGFSRVLDREVERRKRDGGDMHALFLDLDNFKKINDVYGHSVGDSVLIAVARILIQSVRASDHVARVGGDEFLVILPNTRRAEARVVAEKIHSMVQRTIVSERFPQLRINASVGLVAAGHDQELVQDMLIRMERALHRAKRLGKGQVFADANIFREEDLRTISYTDMVVEISNPANFFSVKQPLIDLRTNQLHGYELLSRSHCAALASPEDFLNFAMDSGLARQVDLNAFGTCARGCQLIAPELSCHLNILPSTLMNVPVENLVKMLPTAGERSRFCIEISEKETIGDAAKMLQYVQELRDAGLRVAMDDVGYGRSCLEALIQLEPEVVKIDRAMIHMLADDPARRRILERMLRVVATWGAETVAEGIEREADLQVVRDLGIPYGQGFLLGRPA
jgi:diguanylate cyclase (GGDEF)-like protein